MKVTVCFNTVRVVVPCGEGDFSVRDLISKSITRYKKATSKPPDSWVTVHNLRQLDGGILDPDDCLLDVADDREQIHAIFDEANKPDGTSASDHSEQSSPDIFKDSDHKFEPFSCNDIEITGEALCGTPPPLHVRRGSEPALNKLSPIASFKNNPQDPNKRWSAAPTIDQELPTNSTPVKTNHDQLYDGYPGERGEGSGAEKNPTSSSATSSGSSHHSATTTTLSRFSRDGNRCSVQFLSDNPNMAKWAEAADRAASAGAQYPSYGEGKRREPLGGASTPTPTRDLSSDIKAQETRNSVQLVVLVNDRTALGIHVIPSTDRTGHDQGLLVEGIESEGRVARDGRIRIHDIIIEINGQSLRNVTFHQAQEIFKNAMRASELRLLVVNRSDDFRAPDEASLVHGHNKVITGQSKVANVTSTHKVPAASLSSRTQSVMLQSNTRRIGRRINVDLIKSNHGLGFSITTRDNPAGGEAPIYIKNILPQGAAIEDGNLRIGDRLLEVNGTEVTGYSQTEVAGLLRQIPVGGQASLTVSRQEKALENAVNFGNSQPVETQERNPDSPKLPRHLPTEKSSEDGILFPWKQREILTLEIPVHDSERAGLGVSVKGKTSSSGPNGNVDLGIFVKNVIHGGAASKDGRLKQNDQLVNINGMSLVGKSNSRSMKTLRTAMHQEGPNPGMITLTIARRLETAGMGPRSGRDSVNSLGTTSSGTETLTLGGSKSGFNTPTPDQSGTSDASENTVVFLGGSQRDTQDINQSYGQESGCMDAMANNPVIQRITGAPASASLRNESYYRATHDTWNQSQMQQFLSNEQERSTEPQESALGSPTVNLPSRDTVIIHDEYDMSAHYRYPPNHGRPQLPLPQDVYIEQPSHSSDAYMSQSSLDESAPGFSRDQFGRQSISEKRHATLDAKSTDTYQRSKKAREDRERHPDADVQHDGRGQRRPDKQVGPGLGMKKSSSLESLQTMVQEMALEDDGHRTGTGKVPRGRGCNESFRAAVDRSYDAPLSNAAQMETVAEEESESGGSAFGRGNSRQSSLSSNPDGKKGNRKNKRLLKGLGSMFRFGKHRKGLESATEEEIRKENYDAAKKLHQEEHDRMQAYYQQMVENQNRLQNAPSHSGSTLPADDDMNPSKLERMHQLRAEHQRRHMERKGAYPTDELDDRFEPTLKQRLEPVPPEPKAEIRHIRSQSHDNYRDSLKKPKSRVPLQDPYQYSHYANYEQIQMHLRKNKEQDLLAKLANQQYQDFRDKQSSREQREYQSQRLPREAVHQQRPVSNYFEYESVQAMMSHAQTSGSTLPRRPQPGPPARAQAPPPPHNRHGPHVQLNKAPHPRNQPMNQYNYQGPPRGPPLQAQENIYAASGYRPASQFNQQYPPQFSRPQGSHPQNHPQPGSKVI